MSSEDLAPEIANARDALAAIGGDAIRRHIFLCAMSEKQSCCTREAGEAAWKYLKRRLLAETRFQLVAVSENPLFEFGDWSIAAKETPKVSEEGISRAHGSVDVRG